ncbi:MAG: TFIIB-type zinc ribbon-containing protein [Anaerolineales bacterium]|nr:TFIIB-type zinc ribbon-containing protein [Anaerolineales bacterium]
MSESQYRARQVRAKTHEVVEYDHDESKPGKPLHIMIPGGLVALGALGTIILIAYLTWFETQLNQTTGLILIGLLFPFYVGGVFLFSYGYELYNLPRAIRLTAIIVFLTVAAVVIVAVLALVLFGGGKLPSGSSKRGSSKGGRSVSEAVSSLGATKVAQKSVSPSSSGWSAPNLGNVVVLGGGGTRTREVTKEVTKEVEVPVAPRSVECPFCGRSYVPADEKYICPSCGAATPQELIDESEKPRARE